MPKRGPCAHCGVKTSPLWRNGPPEMPVLCNACGSRWRIRGNLSDYTPRHAFRKRRNVKLRFTEVRGKVKRKCKGRGRKKDADADAVAAAATNTAADYALGAGTAANTLLAIKWGGQHKSSCVPTSSNQLLPLNNQVGEEESTEQSNTTGSENEISEDQYQCKGSSAILNESSTFTEMMQRQLSDMSSKESPSFMTALTGTTLLYNVNPHLSESEIGIGVTPLESIIAPRKEPRTASLLMVSELPHGLKIRVSSTVSDLTAKLPTSTSPRPPADGACPKLLQPKVTDKFNHQATSSPPFRLEDDEQDLWRYFQPLPGDGVVDS